MLSERLFEQSDPFIATVCETCGLLAQPAADKTIVRNKKPFCKVCGTSNTVHDVRMPYAFKLLLQELMAMNIAARLNVDHGPSTEDGARETRARKDANVPVNLVGEHDDAGRRP